MQCPYCLSVVEDSSVCHVCDAKLPVDEQRDAEVNEYFDHQDEGEDYDEWCEWMEGEEKPDIDESMDGDFDSAMTSAGMGTDEDYGQYDAEFDQWD